MLPHEVPAGALAIDTDAFSAVHWGRGRQAEFSALIDGHELAMPFPVVGELWVGAIRAGLGERRRALLETDVDCDLPPETWHLMAAPELAHRGGTAHPAAIRAVLTVSGCGTHLTREGVAGVIRVIERAEPRTDLGQDQGSLRGDGV